MVSLVSPFTIDALQSATGFQSPNFSVDSSGNIITGGDVSTTGNISTTGNLLLTTGSIKLGGVTLLSPSALGPSIHTSSLTSVGTLTGLTVSGTTSLTGAVNITPNVTGTIENISIGLVQPGTGNFLSVNISGLLTTSQLLVDAVFVASPTSIGSLNNVTIGTTTRQSGYFTSLESTSLTSTGTTTFNPLNANVTISPTGTGSVTINPTTSGTIDNIIIGAVTPKAANFTSISATSMTLPSGNITMPDAPSLSTHVVNKAYVDSFFTRNVGISVTLSS